jgi:hypothetical protein
MSQLSSDAPTVLSKTAFANAIDTSTAQLLGSEVGICHNIDHTLCHEYMDQPNTLHQSNEINRYILVA